MASQNSSSSIKSFRRFGELPMSASLADPSSSSTSHHSVIISIDHLPTTSPDAIAVQNHPPQAPPPVTSTRRRFSLLGSPFWLSLELFVTFCQILAAVVVLALSQNERPETPLPAWVIGYAVGCAATLPLVYWRYAHNPSMEMQESFSVQSNAMPLSLHPAASQLEAADHSATTSRAYQGFSRSGCIRIERVMERLRISLDCFFAVWFVLGNVWVFGRPSSAQDSPKLYRLCVAFLSLSCVRYAMPFIFCAAVCCCLPCVVSLMGFRESEVEGRGARPHVIAVLPIYKFRSKRVHQFRSKENYNDSDSDSSSEGGGVMAAGTENEKVISADDAACCICLRRYRDNAELRGLPCGHHFHVECVDQWLRINASCPLCKFAIQGSKDDNGATDTSTGDWRSRWLYRDV